MAALFLTLSLLGLALLAVRRSVRRLDSAGRHVARVDLGPTTRVGDRLDDSTSSLADAVAAAASTAAGSVPEDPAGGTDAGDR
jgi:hypothetical protein